MAWVLRPWEFQWATELDVLPRYAYTVNKVREHGQLWCLCSDKGWAVGADPDLDPVFPIWPHPDFAIVHAVGDWADARVEPISIDHWRDSITPMLESKGMAVGVFMANDRWVHVWPARFLEHLESEPRKHYDLPRSKER